ncbi:hypothetical protein Enr17x_34990 [Gimesia fumaroli]|jgi:hypothetical protein|uniref:Uncharacterized protein n=1 Tax=Gimesia fumaroli TaxID=2527976 RepID=A0A518IEC0_9PLAN|nr:hypothetical protein Enr17x_34990 [Gimesia fumaroli]
MKSQHILTGSRKFQEKSFLVKTFTDVTYDYTPSWKGLVHIFSYFFDTTVVQTIFE